MNVHSRIIHNRQNVERTQMSMTEWILKMWFIQRMKYHSQKRSKILKHAMTWMKLKNTM